MRLYLLELGSIRTGEPILGYVVLTADGKTVLIDTAGSGLTLLQQDTATSHATNEDQVVNAMGQYAGTFTLSRSSNWSAVAATFKQ